MIKILAHVVAGVFAVLGIAAAIFPETTIAASRHLVSPAGIIAAAALRCGLGVALLLIARTSRAPGILRAMGILLLVVGVALPFLGVESARARIEWEAEHMPFLRVEGALFVWAGFIIYKLAQPVHHGSHELPDR